MCTPLTLRASLLTNHRNTSCSKSGQYVTLIPNSERDLHNRPPLPWSQLAYKLLPVYKLENHMYRNEEQFGKKKAHMIKSIVTTINTGNRKSKWCMTVCSP